MLSHSLLVCSLSLMAHYSVLSSGIKCHQCYGLNCSSRPTCKGDYCMVSKYGSSEIIKGCVFGDLLKNTINDHCERFDETQLDVQMCICKTDNFCHSNIHRDNSKTQKSKLLTCTCSNCTSNVCVGEYCTYSMNEQGGEIVQGCFNQSLPLIDKIVEGSCMMPPTSMMHVRKEVSGGKGRQACFCTEDYCNRNQPKVAVVKESVTCEMAVKINSRDKIINRELGMCNGEYCFNIEISAGKLYYGSRGCMSFIKGHKMPEEINDTGCMRFMSDNFEIKACFGKEDQKNRTAIISNNGAHKEKQLFCLMTLFIAILLCKGFFVAFEC